MISDISFLRWYNLNPEIHFCPGPKNEEDSWKIIVFNLYNNKQLWLHFKQSFPALYRFGWEVPASCYFVASDVVSTYESSSQFLMSNKTENYWDPGLFSSFQKNLLTRGILFVSGIQLVNSVKKKIIGHESEHFALAQTLSQFNADRKIENKDWKIVLHELRRGLE